MKNLQFLLVFFMLGLGLVSCSKKETVKLESDLFTNLSLETKAVLAQTDLTAMKQSYSMLTNDEQEMLWKAKLTYIIKNDDLSQGQTLLLNKMLSFLNQNGIAKLRSDNSIADKFISENAAEFYRNFNAEQLYFIIEHPFIQIGFSLRNAKKYISGFSTTITTDAKTLAELDDAAATCTCRYDIGCGFGNSCNTSSGCNGGSDCGLFGTSRCKGRCEQGSGGPVLLEQ